MSTHKIKKYLIKLAYRSSLSVYFLSLRNRIIIKQIYQHAQTFNAKINQIISLNIPSKYQYKLNSKLPQSAWFLQNINGDIAEISFGTSVYQHPDGIIEGVWDNNFQNLDYINADHVFGSGIYIENQKITFVPPSYLLEGIFFLYDKTTKSYCASNSLACLLSLSLQDEKLETILSNIDSNTGERLKKGIFSYDPILFEDNELIILLFCYHNFSITNDGLSLIPKIRINKFVRFNDYKSYVKEKIQLLLENGKSDHRENTPKLSPLATISSGYDSTASAAIVHDLGVKEAVTIDVNVYERNDSGSNTAQLLGMNCTPCRHPFGQSISDLNLEESSYEDHLDKISIFLATFGMGDDSSWLAFESFLPNKIVFTGHGGDEIWYKDEFIGNGLRKITCFELSLGEYRLKQGFVRVAVPYIGTVFTNYIYRLNFLQEMMPYTLNNSYDRPLPRRFAEEAGIPRDGFAQIKRATNPNLLSFQKYKIDSFRKHMKEYRNATS